MPDGEGLSHKFNEQQFPQLRIVSSCVYEKDNFVFARVSALFPPPTHLLRS